MKKSQAQLALQQYSKVGIESGVEAADPHRIIQMLMQGTLDKISIAMGHMRRHEDDAKGSNISLAVTILGGLAASLDQEEGGEIAVNLALLYDYMTRRLLEANLRKDPAILREVHGLMRQIKQGWDAIAPQTSQRRRAAESGAVTRSIAPLGVAAG